jgi:alpha-aminoadipate carrier protein LysW
VSATAVCPECEFAFDAGDLEPGETLACLECGLTLQVISRGDTAVELRMIEADLPDWGQ